MDSHTIPSLRDRIATLNFVDESSVTAASPPPLPRRRLASIHSIKQSDSRTGKWPPPLVPPPLRDRLKKQYQPSVADESAETGSSTRSYKPFTTNASMREAPHLSETVLPAETTAAGASSRPRLPSEAQSDQARSAYSPRGAHLGQAGEATDSSDPAVQSVMDELMEMRATKDELEANKDFLLSYIKQKQKVEMAKGVDSASKSSLSAPPPPPPPPLPPSAGLSQSSQNRQPWTSNSEPKPFGLPLYSPNGFTDRDNRAKTTWPKTREPDIAQSAAPHINPANVRHTPFLGSAVTRLPPNAHFEDLVAAMMMDVTKDMQRQVREKLVEINESSTETRDGELTSFE